MRSDHSLSFSCLLRCKGAAALHRQIYASMTVRRPCSSSRLIDLYHQPIAFPASTSMCYHLRILSIHTAIYRCPPSWWFLMLIKVIRKKEKKKHTIDDSRLIKISKLLIFHK